jgi:hypothetical protein
LFHPEFTQGRQGDPCGYERRTHSIDTSDTFLDAVIFPAPFRRLPRQCIGKGPGQVERTERFCELDIEGGQEIGQ